MKRLQRTSVFPRTSVFHRSAVWSLAALLSLVALASCGGPGKVDPDNSGAQLAFGIQMAKRGLWSEALFRFERAERMRPNSPRTLNNMAVAYEALGQFELALDYYQRALKASPSDSELRRNYSRFVEFYRNFKAETEGEEEGGEGEGATASGAP